jgi:hypothetical protein
MSRAVPALTLLLSIAGCTSTTGIVPVGPDTYILSEMRAPVRGGGAAAQVAVLSEATAFCQQQGRELALLSLLPDGDPRIYEWPTAFNATFQCRVTAIP